MTSLALLAAAFALTYAAARRSLREGLCVLLTIGYAYGVIRANRLDGYSHLLVDAALLGLYLAAFGRRFTLDERSRTDELRMWLYVMIGWPLVLFMAPTQDVLVELVGLRGNVFMLPCMLIGARLRRDELGRLALWLATLNIAAAAFAAVQFFVGIEPFFPRNPVTELIYRSGDLAGGAFRLPSSFANAHAFGGTMVGTLPLLAGAWMQSIDAKRRLILSIAIVVTVLSVFAAGARLPVLLLFALAMTVMFSGHMRFVYKVRWLFVALAVAYVVSGEVRLQRFLTLRDPEFVSERIAGSINVGFFDLVQQYPLGNGLGGGGTSMPYFLQDRVRNVVGIENEFGRIVLEQGIPGLLIWVVFIGWVFTRRTNIPGQPWFMARRLSLVWCLGSLASALLGIGLLTSIPMTILLMLALGWITVPESADDLRPASAPVPLQYEQLA